MTTCQRAVVRATVRELRATGRDGFLLRVALPAPLVQPLEGGHFFMLRTDGPDFPFLNRPFSVHEASHTASGSELAFLFKAIGRGTGCLSRLRAGDSLTLVGPLGQPFPAALHGDTTILVAGGVGLPPLYLWLKRRQEQGSRDRALLLYGARSRDQLFELDAALALGVPVRTATEDGSHGLRGRVDKLLEATLDELAGQPTRVYTCGPDPMMAAVSRIATRRGIPCLASLETLMACGFGVCNACAVPVTDGDGTIARYARACVDGPVMDASQVLWQAAAH
ncbi:MAG: dihydroorotate dehydrogenase electron transfer subunit [Planctomycetes bacterium]|nr:dihydroorotate dehydrogenase electron transfer subunit [Planctomycetota bacterium]